jgi:copper chaperone CopZ
MTSLFRFSAVAALVLALGLSAGLRAADSKDQQTVMTLGEMCGGCVKKITAKLEKMSGVAAIRCDIEAKTVSVTPKRDVTLSPRSLWETMEEIGKTPKKLTGPSGTFTEKPKK